jgi:glycosyltransferase involved in cell wall biosynthesis
LKILLTCDPEIPVPPTLYGGVERLVDGLARGYKNEGHEVYLVANPGSTCIYTKKNYKWPATHSRGVINIIRNAFYLLKVVSKLRPDVIHSFSRLLYGYPLFLTKKIPFLQTYGRKISAKSTSLALKIAGDKLHFTSCAAHMLVGLPNQKAFTPVFNFTDVDYFTYNASIQREHLMFLGRIENIKGTKEAIEAAIKSNHKIIVAGNIQPGHDTYFKQEIKPLLENHLVEYVGPVNDDEKKYYLQRSSALLFPIKWEEPFGIVLAEALACGTPVIGFNRGSVPEVVQEGKNGFIVSTVEEMVNAVHKIDQLNSEQIRRDAAVRFSLQNISKEYLDLLQNYPCLL